VSSPGVIPKFSGFGLRRGQRSRFGFALESNPAVGAVAEGLVLGMATAAETDHRAAGQIVGGSGVVLDLEIPFDAERSVGAYNDFGWHRCIVAQLRLVASSRRACGRSAVRRRF
jgi:hypothetical protein